MKIERILIHAGMGTLHHTDSQGDKEIRIDKKNCVAEGLRYIEEYCTKNGFELFDTFTGQSGIFFTLVKK